MPEFNQDLLKEMNREKEKLNRFLDTKEASIMRHQQYEEKMRKQLFEKEKKAKKVFDLMKKEQKEKLKKMRETDEAKRGKLRQKEMDVKELQNESKRQYVEHLKEIKQKREEQINKEKEIALADYKRNQAGIKSPGAMSQKPAKQSAFDANMVLGTVNDQLFKFEQKMQKSVNNNQEFLKRKSDAAGVGDVTMKLAQVNENRAKQDADVLNSFVHTVNQREKKLEKFNKIQKKKQ